CPLRTNRFRFRTIRSSVPGTASTSCWCPSWSPFLECHDCMSDCQRLAVVGGSAVSMEGGPRAPASRNLSNVLRMPVDPVLSVQQAACQKALLELVGH